MPVSHSPIDTSIVSSRCYLHRRAGDPPSCYTLAKIPGRYEILGRITHASTPTVRSASIQIYASGRKFVRGDDATQRSQTIVCWIPKGVISIWSHGLHACTQNRFRLLRVALFLFCRKIASLDGHFTTVSQVESGNTNGIDIWMVVYIRGYVSVSWVDPTLPEKGYADLLPLVETDRDESTSCMCQWQWFFFIPRKLTRRQTRILS